MVDYLSFNFPYPLLSILIFLPLLGGLIALLFRQKRFIKYWAFGISLVTFILSIPLFTNFDTTTPKFQFAEYHSWVPCFKINYALGADGFTVLLILLTTLLTPICILCSWRAITKRIKEFMFCLLLMESAIIGVFSALDFFLFYIFWEAMLVPMYLLIAVWGGPNKAYASLKFFIYTLAGSVFLMVAMIALYLKTGTFSIPELMQANLPFHFQCWVFLAFAIAFAIKVPLFPFHTWLPAAHVEAPTAGSVFLASLLLKMGTYGFVRFCLPITPQASHYFAPLMIFLAIASIIYGGYVALGQKDMKRLIAYSSVAHMGFVVLGIFVFNLRGIEGAVMQMVSHGITTGALFLMIGIIYERTHSRLIVDNAGIGQLAPWYVTFLGFFSFSSFAFPGTNSFIGEFLVLSGAFLKNKWVGALAVPGALLAAAYMLRLLQSIIWRGKPKKPEIFVDLYLREICFLTPLLVLVFWIGLSPGVFLRFMDTSIQHLLTDIMPKTVGIWP